MKLILIKHMRFATINKSLYMYLQCVSVYKIAFGYEDNYHKNLLMKINELKNFFNYCVTAL